MDEGVFGAEIRSKGVPIYSLGMKPGVFSPKAFWRLITIVREAKPDVLMTWLYHADFLGMLVGLISGVRRIYWNIRCSDMSQSFQSVTSLLLLKALVLLSWRPAGVVVNSHAGKEHHIRLGYRPKQWHIITNGVNLDLFQPDPQAKQALCDQIGVPHGTALIGHVARFHPMKDHHTLFSAIAKVLDVEPDIHFVLVGRDVTSENEFFAKELTRHKLTDRVHLLGDRRDVPKIVPGFDLMVLSSAYGEGTPNVLIEGMACGVPCVTTDVGDAALVVGEYGRVVPTGDAEALAREILNWSQLSDEQKADLSRDVRERVEQNYGIAQIIDQYDDLIDGNLERT
jgi:glycosyltransferase involved in cell wall biosynthesis